MDADISVTEYIWFALREEVVEQRDLGPQEEWSDYFQNRAWVFVDTPQEAEALVSKVKKEFSAAGVDVAGDKPGETTVEIGFEYLDGGGCKVSVVPKRLLKEVFPMIQFTYPDLPP